MGDRRAGAPVPEQIDSWERYSEIAENESQTKLVIIDCYQAWCGPTQAMQAFW